LMCTSESPSLQLSKCGKLPSDLAECATAAGKRASSDIQILSVSILREAGAI
jgi:hypothetical protein